MEIVWKIGIFIFDSWIGIVYIFKVDGIVLTLGRFFKAFLFKLL